MSLRNDVRGVVSHFMFVIFTDEPRAISNQLMQAEAYNFFPQTAIEIL
jgi:hypothetical protein